MLDERPLVRGEVHVLDDRVRVVGDGTGEGADPGAPRQVPDVDLPVIHAGPDRQQASVAVQVGPHRVEVGQPDGQPLHLVPGRGQRRPRLGGVGERPGRDGEPARQVRTTAAQRLRQPRDLGGRGAVTLPDDGPPLVDRDDGRADRDDQQDRQADADQRAQPPPAQRQVGGRVQEAALDQVEGQVAAAGRGPRLGAFQGRPW
ncbi:hypothetical protein BJY14_003367 [Actinomadura luteofluorescens]|uniref:Uncharacterized protein n=1 Tax=Actinomadura luteofluorescens TaxID=46163 RepID=A0A7Y9EGQ2_9ACTN|nr:hypothetical protein [Actinomadura luteofluorescens]NYD47384.1 hypothetical protein [Actinomadura luteofluorescens]